MSPRAACRLDALGFEQVYDYTLGVADWKAAGEPIEGPSVNVQVVADATRPDIPTANLQERLGTVRDRTVAAGWDEALVVDCDGVVVGRLRGDIWDQDRNSRLVEVMEPGPTTVRPNGALAPLVKRMEERGTKLVTVTTPQGVLIGVFVLQDAQRLVTGEPPEQIWVDCEGCPGQWKPQPRNPTNKGSHPS
jgi:CBS domain-containing protein